MLLKAKPLILPIAFSLWMAGCASSPKKEKKISLSQEQIDQMDQALSLMKSKEFAKAAEIYDELGRGLTDASSKALMLFNAGTAYKEAGQCKKALSRFRKLLDASLKLPVFKARGLVEISYVYECLGKADLAFMSLKDGQKLSGSLPWDIRQIVYPARLAIARARLGHGAKAESYKRLALDRVLRSKSAYSSEEELSGRMSRLFYMMGRSYIQKSYIQTESFIRAFPYHQLFLLQSLFLKNKDWAGEAKKELEGLFGKLLFALSSLSEKGRLKYKKAAGQAIKEGMALTKKERSKEWEMFYSSQADKILKLFPQLKQKNE